MTGPTTKIIDTLSPNARQVIAEAGIYACGRLNPPRTPVQFFHEADQRGLDWLVARVRGRFRDGLSQLQDREVLTVIIDGEEE